MKKIVAIALIFVLLMAGCGKEQKIRSVDTIETQWGTTYYELSDGTWQIDDMIYQYKIEVSGTMPNAAKESTFVYLSNLEEITFEQAWKAAGLSSLTTDYFTAEEATLVEWR